MTLTADVLAVLAAVTFVNLSIAVWVWRRGDRYLPKHRRRR